MENHKKIILISFLAITAAFGSIFWYYQAQPVKADNTVASENQVSIEGFGQNKIFKSKVIKVIDGDSIILENGAEVRYIGIDAPEITYPDCFAQEAKAENERLVLGKDVILAQDVSETDKEGRYLAYVYVDDLFINEYMVENGYAYALAWNPDTKYANSFSELQRLAKYKKLGLWSACNIIK